MEFGYYNADCMDIMRELPDKFADLAIVDPPYGIKQGGDKNHTRGKLASATKYHTFDDSTPPGEAYFSVLICHISTLSETVNNRKYSPLNG